LKWKEAGDVGHHRIVIASTRFTFLLSLAPFPSPLSDDYLATIHPSTALHIHLAMPSTTAETLSLVNRSVSVAPLVLLSATDHYARSAKGTRKRVVGVLLGQNDGKDVRVSNSFAGMLPLLFGEPMP
jgi:hypothetical protein